jgi:hypothetical protein
VAKEAAKLHLDIALTLTATSEQIAAKEDA